MSPTTLMAFDDELQKIAAGPKIVHDRTLEALGVSGLFVSADKLATTKKMKWLRKTTGTKPGQDLIMLVPAKKGSGYSKSMYAAVKEHELTHMRRNKEGKLKGYGKPGLANIVRTFREEAIAYYGGLKAKGELKALPVKVLSLLAGPPASTWLAYFGLPAMRKD
jgi:hypothetical protein